MQQTRTACGTCNSSWLLLRDRGTGSMRAAAAESFGPQALPACLATLMSAPLWLLLRRKLFIKRSVNKSTQITLQLLVDAAAGAGAFYAARVRVG